MTPYDAYDAPSPCESCPRRGRCSIICGRYRAWFGVRWNMTRELFSCTARRRPDSEKDAADTPEKIFAARLLQLRRRRGIGAVVLSELCGLSPGTVRRFERGEAAPDMTSMIALACYFGVSVDYLIGRDVIS